MKLNTDTRILLATTIGVAIQIYNFVIYILLSSIIALTFFGKNDFNAMLYTYIIFAAGYFIRPFGGVLIEKIGRKFGMRSTYLMTIMLMAFSTVFMGSLPSYLTFGVAAPFFLLFFRLLQGVAMGGELPAGLTLLFEHVKEEKKLVGCAFITFGVEVGLLLAIGVAFVFTNMLTHEELIVWGWRPPFFIGAILAAVGFYVRYILTDIPELQTENDISNQVQRISFIKMIRIHSKETFVSLGLNVGLGIFVSIFCLFMPLILHEIYKFKLSLAYDFGVSFMIVYMLATVLSGYLVKDFKFSPKILFIVCSILVNFFAVAFIKTVVGQKYGLMFISYILLACTLAGSTSMIPYLLANIFPEKARFSGVAFSYNIAQAIGSGLTPIFIVLIFKYGDNLRSIPALSCMATIIIFIAFTFGVFGKNKNNKPIL